jgi:hypothetical protein
MKKYYISFVFQENRKDGTTDIMHGLHISNAFTKEEAVKIALEAYKKAYPQLKKMKLISTLTLVHDEEI